MLLQIYRNSIKIDFNLIVQIKFCFCNLKEIFANKNIILEGNDTTTFCCMILKNNEFIYNGKFNKNMLIFVYRK